MPTRDTPAFAVIGAGYGDEGKGLMTDALAHGLGPSTWVIRHNGGAQAGHTVTLPDRRTHVFHHVGSGSFAGASTFLPRFFVANPIVLAQELAALGRLGVVPRIVADENGLLTTPWDMMINQFVEEARGGTRHGSCGLGFGETIERCLDPSFATPLALLRGDLGLLRDRFDRIRREWVPARLTRLGIPASWLEKRGLILSEEGFEQAVTMSVAMLGHLDLAGSPAEALPVDAPLVFEGAQGLMLDQTRGAFPHVTRSNTGLANVAALAAELGLDRVETVYATRGYVTRHGAGPLAHEQAEAPSPLFRDPTNRPNPWQGTLRFAPLDRDVLGQAIAADRASVADAATRFEPRLAMTCLDQFDRQEVRWVEGGQPMSGSAEILVARLAALLPDAPAPIESHGPTRATLRAVPLPA